MSKPQNGFLGKVSKGIKKSIFDDEPDATSGSLIIERLHSLAGVGLPGEEKAKTEPPIAAPATPPLAVDAGYRAGGNTTSPDETQDAESSGPKSR